MTRGCETASLAVESHMRQVTTLLAVLSTLCASCSKSSTSPSCTNPPCVRDCTGGAYGGGTYTVPAGIPSFQGVTLTRGCTKSCPLTSGSFQLTFSIANPQPGYSWVAFSQNAAPSTPVFQIVGPATGSAESTGPYTVGGNLVVGGNQEGIMFLLELRNPPLAGSVCPIEMFIGNF